MRTFSSFLVVLLALFVGHSEGRYQTGIQHGRPAPPPRSKFVCPSDSSDPRDGCGYRLVEAAHHVLNSELLRFLIKKCRCDPHSPDAHGHTALEVAATVGHMGNVHAIVETAIAVHSGDGVHPTGQRSTVTKAGKTPLEQACHHGHTEVAAYLLSHGAALDEPDSHGRTALMEASSAGRTDTVAFLIGRGADATAVDGSGFTALHFASLNGHKRIVEMLLEAGADPHVKCGAGNTPLREAAFRGHVDIVRHLVDKGGADVNARNEYGGHPLYYAAGAGHHHVVEALIEKGADPHAETDHGVKPHHVAKNLGHHGIAEMLEAIVFARPQQSKDDL